MWASFEKLGWLFGFVRGCVDISRRCCRVYLKTVRPMSRSNELKIYERSKATSEKFERCFWLSSVVSTANHHLFHVINWLTHPSWLYLNIARAVDSFLFRQKTLRRAKKQSLSIENFVDNALNGRLYKFREDSIAWQNLHLFATEKFETTTHKFIENRNSETKSSATAFSSTLKTRSTRYIFQKKGHITYVGTFWSQDRRIGKNGLGKILKPGRGKRFFEPHLRGVSNI